jgi:molecular chaperone DnaK (HSP70)
MSAEYEDLEARFRRFGTQDAGGRSASRTRLVVGIDFGTTYTGVAYSHTADDNMSDITDWTLEQIRDKIVAIKQWPNADPLYPEKAPTVLAYQNGAVVAWGGSVKPSHPLRVAHFKLGLQESVAQHYSSSSTIGAAISILGGFLNDHKWRHPELPRKQPVDFAADYLKAIREYVLESALTRHLGKEFLHNQPIQYVITVPAIWSDKAKDLTRKAATRAGIPENDLSLVTEPEAAALYCSTLCNEVNLNDGDRFLICDAGGGTVV